MSGIQTTLSTSNRVVRNDQDGREVPWKVDLPLATSAVIATLLDRYFSMIAPYWPLVQEEDLNQEPYTSPLLLRSVCLVSAHLDGARAHTLVEDIAQAVHQCFDAYELLSLPTVSTLQSILLMLASPRFSQQSMMTASACRMALTLGLHRPHYPKPILYWSCIVAARWESLRSVSTRLTDRVCFDLETTPPHTEPDPKTVFGALYHLLACADENRERLGDLYHIYRSQNIYTYDATPTGQEVNASVRILGEEPETVQTLVYPLVRYLSEDGTNSSDASSTITDDSPAFELNPFYCCTRRIVV
ncbi:uncharacterized protein Z519_12043 [Cladophialophora bantiana CBS 173.52]|uniref:Xylanolytic transcriptional activator regulatory domain-containing protein n=1 Tax=Cladophialophora bantiana (strain ATCC 10958 / CBS 173.52 / CDC B-1940 / NIH 8579) TaxID=1442370 RepID=A0A0D2FL40_CLAB1|nr:uncharacterized protein Z519_12043 [Cladophialophora bantiana CBS 173.52]KIW87407.1 hypothetical protein Z519_12043 [Cladophialophora bantiana CBS 173.52]